MLSLASCSKLARCEMDKVRAEVLDYDEQVRELRPLQRRWKRHIEEFEGKIFTNQKAGVDLLRAVLVKETWEMHRQLKAVKVRSRLLRKPHDRRVAAVQSLARAYEGLMKAYPKEDFAAIRKGLKAREEAMRRLARAELAIKRLIQKYRRGQRR